MLSELQNYLTFETIYLWANFGILPFWLMIIFIPQLKITRILVNSIIIPLLLGFAYCYVIYQGILFEDIFFIESFNLYRGLDSLYTIFSNEIFSQGFNPNPLSSFISPDTKYDKASSFVLRKIISFVYVGLNKTSSKPNA